MIILFYLKVVYVLLLLFLEWIDKKGYFVDIDYYLVDIELYFDLDYLLTFPLSTFVTSFALDEAAADVKNKLANAGGHLNPQLIAKIEGLIDGAIADYQHSK